MRDIWLEWDWRAQPEAPRGWEHPERMVVLVEGLHCADKYPANLAYHEAECRGAVFVDTETLAVLVSIAGLLRDQQTAYLPKGFIPALRIERRADLGLDALWALGSVPATHRALVISPREGLQVFPLDDYPLGPSPWPLIDLVVVRGPTGADAWPMHPAWVASIRDQCAAACVPFAFLGWGDFIPEQSYPPEINGFTKRRNAWMYDGCVGPMPEPEGVEGSWWGEPSAEPGGERKGRIITDWGALDDDDGTFVSGWTGWRNSQRFCRVGPEHSGRLLDGAEHLALPEGL